ncbi:MAG: TRAP transporter substrate-binding protein [Lautropia sp.]|nr:TRAP transporter substrate-binding protein [Lautropia sp.]
MSISRRTFMTTSGAVLASPLFPGILRHARAAVTLTLGHGAAPGNPRAVAAERFARLVGEKTAGAVEINLAGSEQLGSDAAMLTSLRTGVLDFSINSQGPTSAVTPELNVLSLPFLFRDSAQALQVLNGAIGTQLSEALEAKGLVVLDWWDNGTRHITNSKRAIEKPADLRGMKIRVPPDAMISDIFRALGASTEQIAFGELYLALQQGVVDGQENPLANIDSSKLYEVNRFISLTGHAWSCNPFLMGRVTQGKVGKPELQAIMQAAQEATAQQHELMHDSDATLLKTFKERSFLKINDVDRTLFREATSGVYDSWKKKPFGNLVRQLLDAVG